MTDRSRPSEQVEVVVIGGGPAGTTAATLIAREGHEVVLLDREQFPRFRIGESLMPATYWTLRRLGVLDKMKASAYPRKHSVQFVSKSGRTASPFYFTEFENHESSITWQVDRLEFDKMLLDHAASNGVEVRQQANVREVLFEGDRATGVEIEYADGHTQRIDARVVVDATGQTALIARRLGLKNPDPELRHAAYYTRYRAAWRGEGKDDGATLILQTGTSKTWFWYIPQPDDVVSVGVVGPIETLAQGGDPQTVFDREAAGCPALLERTASAEQLHEVRVMRDFSYISKRIAGDGWIMAGDAFGFLDPIYSGGVFLAFKSGEFAADAVTAAFEEKDFSGASLGRFGDQYVAGMEAMRKLVYAYYDESFHVPQFLKVHPEHRESIVHLLIGNVYRVPFDGLFEAMGEQTDLPDARTLDPQPKGVRGG